MKLIKLQDKFILVSDESIKEDDWVMDFTNYGLIHKVWEVTENHYTFKDSLHAKGLKSKNRNLKIHFKKIIAGTPELPSTDLSLLKEEDCKEIGWVDVERLAAEAVICNGGLITTEDETEVAFSYYHLGFDAAQSLNDKMFSEDDVRDAIVKAIDVWMDNMTENSSEINEPEIQNIIQSLQQTEWDVEVEMEHDYEEHPELVGNPKEEWSYPKITNNSIKVIKIL